MPNKVHIYKPYVHFFSFNLFVEILGGKKEVSTYFNEFGFIHMCKGLHTLFILGIYNSIIL